MNTRIVITISHNGVDKPSPAIVVSDTVLSESISGHRKRRKVMAKKAKKKTAKKKTTKKRTAKKAKKKTAKKKKR